MIQRSSHVITLSEQADQSMRIKKYLQKPTVFSFPFFFRCRDVSSFPPLRARCVLLQSVEKIPSVQSLVATSRRPNICGAVMALGFILISRCAIPTSVNAFIKIWMQHVLPAPLGPRTIIPWRTRWVSNSWVKKRSGKVLRVKIKQRAHFLSRKKKGSDDKSLVKEKIKWNGERPKCHTWIFIAETLLPSFFQDTMQKIATDLNFPVVFIKIIFFLIIISNRLCRVGSCGAVDGAALSEQKVVEKHLRICAVLNCIQAQSVQIWIPHSPESASVTSLHGWSALPLWRVCRWPPPSRGSFLSPAQFRETCHWSNSWTTVRPRRPDD